MSPELIVSILLPLVGLLGPGLVLLGLPGTWLLLVFAGASEWATEERLFSSSTIVVAVALAVAGEVWEFLASSARARRAGAGRRGAVGALMGGIAGALIGTVLLPVPVVGTLVGGGLGAFTGASLLERGNGRPLSEAMRIGRAAAAGQLIGVAGKLLASGVTYALVVAALFVD